MRNPCLRYALSILLLVLPGCGDPPTNHYQGYIEGEYLRIASHFPGRLEALAVSRGMTIEKGAPLFRLEHTLESGAVREAEQGLARAESILADLEKGSRPTEIKTIEARLAQARAAKDLAQKEFNRLEKLVQELSVSQESYDRAASELERATAAVEELTAALETSRLGSRSDAVDAAKAETKAARARLDQARWKLDQMSQAAPEDGLVFDTYYNKGEFVPAGHPVVSLLPPERIKLRFFVPETVVGSLRVGQKARFTYDGAAGDYQAFISYISPEPEYTPPVIYSRESRSKLVFMLEAKVGAAERVELHPGQPVDVRLEPVP